MDLEAVANTKKHNDKLKSEINTKAEDKVVITKHSGCCQIRSNIYSQIS